MVRMVPYRYRTVSYRVVSYYERIGTIRVQYCIAVPRIPPYPCSNLCHISRWREIYSTTIYHVYNIVNLEMTHKDYFHSNKNNRCILQYSTFKISYTNARFIHGSCPACFYTRSRIGICRILVTSDSQPPVSSLLEPPHLRGDNSRPGAF